MSQLLLKIIHHGYPYKMTKAGIIIYGPSGIVGTHFSCSDRRAIKNFTADLRKVGITIEKGT